MKTMKSALCFLVLAWMGAPRAPAQTAQAQKELPIAAGPFQPSLESLTNYSCPEWFRDAKFGIWAHWGRRLCR